MPALQGRAIYVKTPKRRLPRVCVSPPRLHPGQKLGPPPGLVLLPLRHAQGDLLSPSVGPTPLRGPAVFRALCRCVELEKQKQDPVPFRRIPCILGLLLCAVHLLCAGTYVGRWSAGDRPRQSQCSSPEAWVAGQRRAGQRSRTLEGWGWQRVTAPFLRLAVLARAVGGGAQGQGRHSRLAQPQPEPGSALEGGGSSPGCLPESPARLLATSLPQHLCPVRASLPGIECLVGESCPVFLKSCPGFPIDVQGGL